MKVTSFLGSAYVNMWQCGIPTCGKPSLPLLAGHWIIAVRRYLFSVSCILIIPVFRAPSLLDGTFCRFFVGSLFTGYCCPPEKQHVSACQSHHWVTQHQASSNKKVNLSKQIDCIATKAWALDYNLGSSYRRSKKIPKHLRNLQWL